MATDVTDEDLAVTKRRKRRSRWSMGLVIFAAVLLPISGLTMWSRNQLLNTDRYVNTVEPLASDPTIKAAVADRLTQVVTDAADLKDRANDALPQQAKFLAAPIAAGAEQLVHELATKLIDTDQFRTLWREANRVSHEQIVDLLEGKNTAGATREDGKVVINLQPIAEQLLQQLQNVVPINLTAAVPPERLDIRFVLVDSNDLARVQTAVEWFNRAAWILLGLVLLSFILAIVIAPDKRRSVQRVGVGMISSMAVLLVLYNFGRNRYLDSLPSEVQNKAAAGNAFDIITRNVLLGIRVLLVVGVLVFVVSWLFGPSRSAVAIRGLWHRAFGRGRTAEEGKEAAEPGRVAVWVAAHVNELRVSIAGLGIIALFVSDSPSGKTVLGLLVLVAIGWGLVQLLANAGRSGNADTQPLTPPG
jgi:hypothetical protein